MPLFRLTQDYQGFEAGTTIEVSSTDRLADMLSGIGVLVQPKAKATVQRESAAPPAESVKVQQDKPKPAPKKATGKAITGGKNKMVKKPPKTK
jgi:hypothetical protein